MIEIEWLAARIDRVQKPGPRREAGLVCGRDFTAGQSRLYVSGVLRTLVIDRRIKFLQVTKLAMR
jgi:hypothetical protein